MDLLVVEDDTVIREGISEFLSEYGYHVIEARDGKEALDLFNKEIKLVLLDIQIPFINGLEVLKTIRKESDIPEKPFSLIVLKTRIDALIKKYYGSIEKFIYKNIEINFTSYTAKIEGRSIEINPKELEILKCLLNHEGQVLSRMQIIDQVWKETDDIPYDRVIDVYIKELRKKLQLDCITTIRNVGYKLERK